MSLYIMVFSNFFEFIFQLEKRNPHAMYFSFFELRKSKLLKIKNGSTRLGTSILAMSSIQLYHTAANLFQLSSVRNVSRGSAIVSRRVWKESSSLRRSKAWRAHRR